MNHHFLNVYIYVHCSLLIINLRIHFEMILEKENEIYLSDLLSSMYLVSFFFSLSSRMASSYELNVHLMAEVKYHTHTHTYLKIVVSTSLEIHWYTYTFKKILFDYYYTLLLYIKTFIENNWSS